MQGKANVSIGLTLFSVLAKPDLLGNKTVETDKSLTLNTCSGSSEITLAHCPIKSGCKQVWMLKAWHQRGL